MRYVSTQVSTACILEEDAQNISFVGMSISVWIGKFFKRFGCEKHLEIGLICLFSTWSFLRCCILTLRPPIASLFWDTENTANDSITRWSVTTGIFSALLFWERCLLKESKCFFPKCSLSIFSKFKKILISQQKNLTIKVGKTLSINDIIWYTLYSKFATFTNFLKKINFFSKNRFIFQKEPKFGMFWKVLLVQSHSTANVL